MSRHGLTRLTAGLSIMLAVFLASSLGGSGSAHARGGAHASTSCLPSILKTRLNQVRAKFGPITVVSTYRPGARINGSGKPSYHASCRAADFIPSRNYREIVNWLYANHEGGVGTYSCGMNHIHIDNGPSVRFHHCVNGGGSSKKRKR